jgi:anti-sigma B factor antagonist
MPTSPAATFERPPLVPSAASRIGLAVRRVDDVAMLDVMGSVTSDQATHLRERVQELSGGGTKKFVVNLAQVVHMDSSGVGALLAVHKSIQAAGGKCKFACAPSQVLRTLQRVNLHKVFELFEDEGAALSSF